MGGEKEKTCLEEAGRLVKIELEATKAFMDWVEESTRDLCFDDVGEAIRYIVRRYLEEKEEEENRILDDYNRGFVNGYAYAKGLKPKVAFWELVKEY